MRCDYKSLFSGWGVRVGLSNMGGSPAYWAKRLREVSDIYSTEIFCIGITRETSREQLKVVASEPHAAHVFVTDQPNEFKEIIAKMRMDNIGERQEGVYSLIRV